MKCSLKSCQLQIDHEEDAWVKIRLRLSCASRKAEIGKWPVDVHQHNGVCSLHRSCWQQLVDDDGAGSSGTPHGRIFAKRLREAEETAEIFDGRSTVEDQAKQLAVLLRNAKHAVVFTGAGISTSAGIGDFRGLFGKWTEDDMAKRASSFEEEDGDDEQKEDDVPYEDLRPTIAHEAVTWLMGKGMLKHDITQNCDGLHRMSGIPPSSLSELHGNVFIEYCRACGREYERSQDVQEWDASAYYEDMESHGKSRLKKPKAEQCSQCMLTHQTKRKCPACKKALFDTIINFGDDLRVSQLKPAQTNAAKADLVVALGTTLTVTPASNLCKTRKGQNLAICNRQATAFDEAAAIRVHCDCDDFINLVLREIMGKEANNRWVEERSDRMKRYNKQRRKGNKK